MDRSRHRRIGPATGGEAATGPRHVAAIEGLRGLAALSVMLVHLYLMPKATGLWPSGVPEGVTLVLGTGGRGVELFFVISGYLIPASLRRHGSVGRFLVERVMRIMPLYVLLHLVVFLVGPWIAYKFLAGLTPLAYATSFTANLLFLAPLVDLPLAQQNAWSLTYEALFYVWTAAAFLALGSGRNRIALVPLVVGAAILVWLFPPASYFAVGIGFAMLDAPRRIGRTAGLPIGLASLAAMYGLCEHVSVFAGLPFAALLFMLVLDPGSGFATLLGGRWLRYLGRVSYSLYLVHPFVLFAILLIVRRAAPPEAWLWLIGPTIFVGGGIASVIAAGVSHAIVEVRLRRWLEGFFDGPQAQRARPAVDRIRRPEAGVPS